MALAAAGTAGATDATAAVGDEVLHQARSLLHQPAHAPTPPWPQSAAAAAALGWALKAACYEVWNREPGLAARAATLLSDLHQARGGHTLAALAQWTQGIAALGAGHMPQALDALAAAGDTFAAQGDIAHAAETQVPQLMALTVLGRHDAALACGESALRRFATLGDVRSAGKVELNLATLLFRQDRHAEAAARYRQATRHFQNLGDDEHLALAEIGLANALSWRFEFDAALEALARARQRASAGGLHVLSAQAQLTIGQLELHRGQPQRALPALVASCQALDRPGHLPHQVAEAELALADAYLQVNLLPEALTLYDRVVARCSEHGITDELARARLQRALTLARLGEPDAAARELAAAQALFTAQDNPVAGHRAGLLQAALWLQQGQAAQALAAARQAAAALRAAGVPGWAAQAELTVAEALAAAGVGGGGEAANASAREASRAQFQRVLDDPGASAQTDWQAAFGLAALDAAEQQHVAARARLEQVLEMLEAQRAALPGDELRTAFGADKSQAHELLVALGLAGLPSPTGRVARAHEAPALLALADAMEGARSRALTQALSGGADETPAPSAAPHPAPPPAPPSAPPSARPSADVPSPAPADDHRARLAWLNDQAERALTQGGLTAAQRLQTQARRLEAELLESRRRAGLQRPATPVSRAMPAFPPADRADLAAVQAALSQDEAWVQYHLPDRTADGRAAVPGDWVALVVTAEAVSWCRGNVDDLDHRLAGLRFQLDAMRQHRGAPARHAQQLLARTRSHLQALYAQLWAPLADAIGARRCVHVAPHRGLHYVPFAALHDGGHWLAERHALSLQPGATLWLQARRAAAPRLQRLLALGVGGPALPAVAAELDAVAGCFGPHATVLAEAQATRARWQALAGEADVLHLACHAHFRADNPGFSALHLADGPLHLYEMAALQLRPSLVTLSACETGLSRVAPGDEVIGLVRGFQLAGARCVLASLWAVDDGATAALMRDVYAALAAGGDPAAALQRAQAQRAAAGEHPFHWAAFALHGEPGRAAAPGA